MSHSDLTFFTNEPGAALRVASRGHDLFELEELHE